jgi:hypothetical protein
MTKRVEKIDFFTTEHNEKLAAFFKSALSCHKKVMESWNKKNRELAIEGMDEIEKTLRDVKSLLRDVGGSQAGDESASSKGASRIAKLKGMVVTSEHDSLQETLASLAEILYYIDRNLKIATINSVS